MLVIEEELELETIDRNASNAPLRFVRGESSRPITAGTAGMWTLRGEPLLPIHALVLFDGAELYVKPSGPAALVAVDARVAPLGTWTRVSVGGTVVIGSVLTRLRAAGAGGESSASMRSTPPTSPFMSAPAKFLLVIAVLLVLPGFMLLSRVGSAKATTISVGAAIATASPEPDPTPAPSVARAEKALTPAIAVPASLAGTPKLAVDAFAGGRYSEAATHYHKLAEATHDPVFELAERISRSRAGQP